jgi:hypothetical protein
MRSRPRRRAHGIPRRAGSRLLVGPGPDASGVRTFPWPLRGQGQPPSTCSGGALDLATTRFSGRPAPPYPGRAPNCGPRVRLEAYSHEVSTCGYWPGGAAERVFYSYAYPQLGGLARPASSRPKPTRATELAEFVLPYAVVRTAEDPARTLLRFLQSTYAAAADHGHWDRARLEHAGMATAVPTGRRSLV